MSFNLADLFERVAGAVPEREALVHGARRLTYRDLDGRADQVAAALAHAGVRRSDRVAIALRNCPEYLEVMLGAFKLGAVPVNVNYRYTAGELEHVLADSDAKVVIHEPELTSEMESLAGRLPHLALLVSRGPAYERWLESPSAAPEDLTRSSDDLYVLYTGGTTGAPKGVVWRHEDIFFAAMGGGARGASQIAEPEEITANLADPPNRVLLASPLMHGTAHWFAFLTLFAGSTVVLATAPTFDAPDLLDLVDCEGISYLVLVGDAFASPFVDALSATPERWDLTSLTVVVSGGATLSAPVRRALLETLPWIIVVDGYGTSETGGQATRVYTAGMADSDDHDRFDLRPHTAVLDEELAPIVAGSQQVGRVARHGHIPLGYLGDEAATASTFRCIAGERWALTGDQATVDAEGRLLLLGRGSATINSGGEKIHPEEVEAVIREHPAVLDAVVVGVPDHRWGERVAAVVAPRRGEAVGLTDLAAHCKAHLAGFKAPRSIVLVDSVRRLESGKPDYRWARELASD